MEPCTGAVPRGCGCVVEVRPRDRGGSLRAHGEDGWWLKASPSRVHPVEILREGGPRAEYRRRAAFCSVPHGAIPVAHYRGRMASRRSRDLFVQMVELSTSINRLKTGADSDRHDRTYQQYLAEESRRLHSLRNCRGRANKGIEAGARTVKGPPKQRDFAHSGWEESHTGRNPF